MTVADDPWEDCDDLSDCDGAEIENKFHTYDSKAPSLNPNRRADLVTPTTISIVEFDETPPEPF
jgi:hypothetical protein